MNASSTKSAIALALVTGIGILAYLGSVGVFGNTQLALTLRTNSDLERGLLAHWTFDTSDVSGFDVLDSAGSNNGSIVATTSRGSEVLVDNDTTNDPTELLVTGAQTVWVSDQKGYLFYSEPGATESSLATTTDGGSTWTSEVDITDLGSLTKAAIWFDRWTPGAASGRYLHLSYFSASNDELYYQEYDTQTDTYSEIIQTTNGELGNATSQSSTIVQSRSGVLYMSMQDNTGSVTTVCSSNCTATSSWSVLGDDGYASDQADPSILLPVVNTDNVALVYEDFGDTVSLNVYSATSSSWWGAVELIDTSVDGYVNAFNATYDQHSGLIYLFYIDDNDDYSTQDHDIEGFTIDPVTFATTSVTNVLTDASGGLDSVKVVADANREGHLYVTYVRRATISDSSTRNVYYKLSTDGGSTWGGEVGPLNATQADIEALGSGMIEHAKITTFYQYDTSDDVYIATVANIGDYEDDKTVRGTVGQAIDLDGSNDYVEIPSSAGVDLEDQFNYTIAAWVNGAAIADQPNWSPIITKGGASSNDWAVQRNSSSNDLRIYHGSSNSTFSDIFSEIMGIGWVHLTVGYNATADILSIYVDGALTATSSFSSNVSHLDTRPVRIGGTRDEATFFNGSIDDVRLYSRELSAEQVSRLYGLGATTKIGKTLTTNSDLENGLVGHWTFDGENTDWSSTTAEALDRSGNNFHGDASGIDTSNVRRGKLGQAFDFSGTSERIEIPDNDTLDLVGSNFTMAAWIKPDDWGQANQGRIIDHCGGSGSSDSGWTFQIQESIGDGTGYLFQGFYGSTNMYSNAGAVTIGEWQHAVITYDGATIRFYTDAEPVGTFATTTSIAASTCDIDIGIRADDTDREFDGQIDDVRIYNRALSPEEVTRLYGLGATTKVSKTINTSFDLENGLVSHYTFDGNSIDDFTVSDRMGTNNGSIIATTTRGNDVVVDASLASGSDDTNRGTFHRQVWLTDQVGYLFFIAGGSDLWVASTTDGGATWGTEEIESVDGGLVQIWHDDWTLGDSQSTIIHISHTNTSSDELRYIEYDTSTDTFSSAIDTTSTGESFGFGSIPNLVKTKGGTLYQYVADSNGQKFVRCSSNCTTASNWSELTGPSLVEGGDTTGLFPIIGTESLGLVYLQHSSDDLDFYVYSATSSSWWPEVQLSSTYESGGEEVATTFNRTTGRAYVAIIDDNDDFVTEDHDIDIWEFNPSTYAWTEKTNATTTASGGLVGVAIAVDENTGEIYVAYNRRTTIGTANTGNIYYVVSSDGGDTWSNEIGPINDSPDDLRGLSISGINRDRIGVQWENATDDDLYFVTVEDIGDYEDEKVTRGRIGQAMKFDGSNDYTTIPDSASFDYSTFTGATWAAWIRPNTLTATQGDDMTIFSHWADGSADRTIQLYIDEPTDEITLQTNNLDGNVETGEAVLVGEWYHVVGTWSASNYTRLYVDGVRVDQDTAVQATLDANTNDHFIGARQAAVVDEYFNGDIDDVRIYDRVLSDEEILRLYQLGQ